MERAPFFTQLKFLCIHVDLRVKNFKEELSQPPGQHPQRYDRGLSKLKIDIQDLKKLSKEIKENLSSFNKFSGYLRDAKELVEEQIAETEKMEQYCAQYGYVIPPKAEADSTPAVEVATLEGGEGNEAKENSPKSASSYQVTPELSDNTRMVLQGKEVPLLTSAKKGTSTSSHPYPETPIASKTPFTAETPFTPGMEFFIPRSHMQMDQFMAGVEDKEESTALTPDVINTNIPRKTKTLTTGKETEIEKPKQIQQTSLQAATPATNQMEAVSSEHPLILTDSCQGTIPCKITTPTEPTLSEYTSQLFFQKSKGKAACAISQKGDGGSDSVEPQLTTPEEPVLHFQQNPLLCTKNSCEENRTPEEPVLHYKENHPLSMMQQKGTPEEPILHYQEFPYRMRGSAKDEDPLEKPVLLYQHTSQNYTDITMKDPIVNSACMKAEDPMTSKLPTSCVEESEEILKTPELSDMAQSFLSLRFHQTHSHLLRDHHRPTEHYRDHMEPPHSHKDHHEPTHHYKEPPQIHKGHQQSSESNRDHHESSHPHRDHKGPVQSHRVPQNNAEPPSHAYHKLGQSFSAAMDQLNRTEDDENTWGIWRTQQHWSNSSASQKDKAVWNKLQAGMDHYQNVNVPPSPQLSDITQKILGQMRR